MFHAVQLRAIPLVCCLATLVSPEFTPAQNTRTLVGFQQRLETLREQLKIPGMAACLVRGQRVVWQQGFGLADVKNNVPVGTGTIFHIASITKTFAATLVLQLVQEGKIKLDDPVSAYGITEIPNGDQVQVRHLLSHTSEEVPPGSQFKYSSYRYGMLERVLVKASGKSYPELLEERIIRPLGLRRTAPNPLDSTAFAVTGLNRAEYLTQLAHAYALDSLHQVVEINYPNFFGTSAGITSSVQDLARYAIALQGGELLAPATLQMATTVGVSPKGESLPYGLGWFVQRYQGSLLVWHYGYWTGNSSLIVRVPERDLTFILLANSDNLSRPFDLMADCADVLSSLFGVEFYNTFVLRGRAPVLPFTPTATAVRGAWRTTGRRQPVLFLKEVNGLARVYQSVGDTTKAGLLQSLVQEFQQTSAAKLVGRCQ